VLEADLAYEKLESDKSMKDTISSISASFQDIEAARISLSN
jgi:hypothetical protein